MSNRMGLVAATALTLVSAGVAVPVLAARDTVGPAAPGSPTNAAAPAGAAAAPAGAGQVAAPQVLEAMQRDLNLSPADAITRLVEEDRARAVERQLRARLGTSFAGAYLSGKDATLTVAVTTPQAAETVRAALAVPELARHSEATLKSVKAALDRRARRSTPAQVSSWYVDVRTNTVTVQASRAQAARAFVAAAGIDPATVRVEVSAEVPRPLSDVRGGDAYSIDDKFQCSVGFSVEGGFVTAGHCGSVGSTTRGVDRTPQGTFRGSSFPGHDYAWVQVNQNWTPQPWVKDASGGNLLVTGSQEAPVGSSVCRSGSRSGWHCGTIRAKDSTVQYAEGAVSGLTRTDVCAEHGDSGGSWVSGQQAQGVTSGGSGDCTRGGTTYFQPLAPILAAFGLKLTTSTGTTDPPSASPTPTVRPTTPPASSPPPTTTTAPPVVTTTPPVVTTAPPVTTTAPPVVTTTPPAVTTTPPVVVTTPPVVTTTPPAVTTPAATTAPPAGGVGCQGYPVRTTGYLDSGRYWIAPRQGWFAAPARTHQACLAGPAGSTAQVFLQLWDQRSGWRTVAHARNRGADAVLTYAGAQGYYRDIAYVSDGAGTATFALMR